MKRTEFLKQIDDAIERWFKQNHITISESHRFIPASKDWKDNVISQDIVAYAVQENFDIDSRANSGHSSQMMLFNLIIPLMLKNDLGILTKLLNPAFKTSVPIPGIAFEYADRKIFNEFGGKPTSVDLMIKQGNQIKYVIEAKFTEQNIGTCSKYRKECNSNDPSNDFDLCPLHKNAGRWYWLLLKKHGFLTEKFHNNNQCVLAKFYQFFRMFLFALEMDSQFVLLYDERNTKIQKEIPVMMGFVPEKHHHRFQEITVQQIVSAITKSGSHSWISDFKSKYAI